PQERRPVDRAGDPLLLPGQGRALGAPRSAAVRLELKPVAALTGDERAALKALTAAVYPPAIAAASPGRHLAWAAPDYSLLIWSAEGELVSHVGLVVRAGSLDGVPVTIGGMGSVKTHPRAEGRG